MQVDLLDPGNLLPETFSRLRALSGLYRHPLDLGRHFWAVTRHADVAAVLADPETFSSARGTGYVSTWDGREELPPYRSLNASDGELHAALRLPVVQRVRDVKVEAPEIQETMDGVRDLADPLALATLSQVVGPLDPRILPQVHTSLYADPLDPAWDAAEKAVMAAIGELERDERFLRRLLLQAGPSASSAAVAGGLWAFARHPEQWPPADMGAAVEEVLRWSSPVMAFGRYVTRDVELGGQALSKGERVVVYFAAANHDEAVFPGGFDATRKHNPHLALGAGPHRCLGAHLARAQVRAVLTALLDYRWTVTGPVVARRGVFHQGLACLPLRFERRGPME